MSKLYGGDKYMIRRENLDKMKQVYEKHINRKGLSKDYLRFVYEIDNLIETYDELLEKFKIKIYN